MFRQVVEGAAVEVAVHNNMSPGTPIGGAPAMAAEDFATLVFDVFARHRCVFGEYPYDRYLFIVRGPGDDPIGYVLTTRVGVDLALNPYTLGSAGTGPPHPYTWPFAKDWAAHEIFHAWNGQLITPAPPSDGRVYQAESWFSEGATVYSTARSRPGDAAFYQKMMGDARDAYLRADTATRNLSFAEMVARTPLPLGSGQPPPPSPLIDLLYQKGALVAYLFDVELRTHGASLGDVMRYMYRNFGLTDRRYTNGDILTAANAVAGADLTPFFERYVTGNAPLPLNGDLDFLP